ncbi:MAG: hypothetical protein FJ291_15715 [Planctomycetes bacterium]|nr:hypothetical protein [Planctomycetota bacterium]
MAAPKTLSRDPKAVARRQMRKLDLELRAFERLRPELLKTHPGLFVAIHHGAVLAADADDFRLAAQVEDLARREGPIAICRVCEHERVEEGDEPFVHFDSVYPEEVAE